MFLLRFVIWLLRSYKYRQLRPWLARNGPETFRHLYNIKKIGWSVDRYKKAANTGVFASKYNFGISNSRFETSRCHIATCSKRKSAKSRIFTRRNVWASKVMYRGSAVNALVVLGIPPQTPQKRSRRIYTTFFSLVARRRLSSSEGAPEGVGEVCRAKPRSRRRYQAQERSIPGSVRTAAWRETWLGPTKDFSRKYIATREISTSLRPLSAVFTMCYANAHPAIWQPTCTELAREA